ncbi:hypothetical protein HDU92_003500, partial [Lobulomyces angularis]
MQTSEMFDEASKSIKKFLIKTSKKNGLMYIPDGEVDNLNTVMQHLTCFAGGMFALSVLSGKSENPKEDTEVAAAITETCFQMYERQEAYKLSPDFVDMESEKLRGNREHN